MMRAKKSALYTIGVFGSTEDSFFGALTKARIDTFCDIRQRRAVRGPKYAYANATRLQRRLEALGIRYIHIAELAPSLVLRNIQKQYDRRLHTDNVHREHLSPRFQTGYHRQNLRNFDVDAFLEQLPVDARRICFFCVENEARACHRSLAAEYLAEKLKTTVSHL